MNQTARNSAGLVWRHQRLVWWIFAVNLALAWLGSLPVRAMLSGVLDHSLESAKLVNGFDLPTLGLLLSRPDVSVKPLAPAALAAAVVFFVYLLFIDGGVITVFLEDRKLTREEFFANAGLYFWRMLRLALFSLLPFGLLATAYSALSTFSARLASDAPQERLGFFVQLAGVLLLLLVVLFVHLWFDVTRAQVVRQNESKTFRTLLRSFRLLFRSGTLYAKYLGIVLFAGITFGVGVAIWFYLPHAAMGASFLVLELTTVTQIVARLWLKATAARWVTLLPTPDNSTPLLPIPVVSAQEPSTDPRAVMDAPLPE